MEVKESRNADFAFGEFRLSSRRRVLLRNGERVRLTPKAFDVLLLLVERAGQVVTRDELIDTIWADSHVEESNLTQTVFMLRKALAQGRDTSYIATAQGRGYRFVADVRIVEEEATARETSRPHSRRAWIVPGILVLAAVAIVALFVKVPRARPAAAPAGRSMLAVLPFDNLTGDAGQEYFSDGLTEEMISQIGRIDHRKLGVIARTSVMQYKGTRTPLARIGHDLGVHYVLEGSVRRDGRKVRVTAQLIRVEDQTHLWSQDYDRELRGLLALERDIAHDIAAQVRLSLDESDIAAAVSRAELTPAQVEAHDAYLKGRYFWNMRTPGGFEEAIKYFELAIASDPHHARAFAGLADCYALLPGYRGVPPGRYPEMARAAARRALELDDRLAEAYTSLALITENYDWDLADAERAYRRAIELDPNYATAHHWYAELLAWQGRFEEALVESERARRLDPLSLIIAADNGMILFYSRQYDRAASKFEEVLELEPSFPGAHKVRQAYVEQGRFDKALASIQALSPDTTLWDLAYTLGRAGRADEAAAALTRLQQLNERQPVDPVYMARAHVGMGNAEDALSWLELARDQRSGALLSLKVDPAWDPLRDEARFRDLLRSAGLEPSPD